MKKKDLSCQDMDEPDTRGRNQGPRKPLTPPGPPLAGPSPPRPTPSPASRKEGQAEVQTQEGTGGRHAITGRQTEHTDMNYKIAQDKLEEQRQREDPVQGEVLKERFRGVRPEDLPQPTEPEQRVPQGAQRRDSRARLGYRHQRASSTSHRAVQHRQGDQWKTTQCQPKKGIHPCGHPGEEAGHHWQPGNKQPRLSRPQEAPYHPRPPNSWAPISHTPPESYRQRG